MQARAALAHLLWRKLNKLEEAISHFQELLRLNPGDNQGNRHAFLCCLLESGDDSALEAALEQCRTYSEAALEPVDITYTCWWYAYACWQFRRHSFFHWREQHAKGSHEGLTQSIHVQPARPSSPAAPAGPLRHPRLLALCSWRYSRSRLGGGLLGKCMATNAWRTHMARNCGTSGKAFIYKGKRVSKRTVYREKTMALDSVSSGKRQGTWSFGIRAEEMVSSVTPEERNRG